MAVRWPWWPTLLLLAAVVLPGATSARPEPPTLGAVAEMRPVHDGVPHSAVAIVARVDAIEAELLQPTPAVRLPVLAAEQLFTRAQVVSLYGYPGIAGMGDLGRYSPEEAAAVVTSMAATYDALNGERGAIGALHLIVSVAQVVPMSDGSYLNRLDHATIAAYVEAAHAHDVLLILDTQLGMVDPLAEARHLETFLAEPFVHLALDPEFAMRASGGVPGDVIGSVDSSEVNAVQQYLAGLVREYGLPRKMLVVHQFRADMLTHSEPWLDTPEVLRTINVDGWGDIGTKLETYAAYGSAPYAEHPGIKLFEGWDVPMMTPEQVLALPRQPDLVVYQ